jgi:hypothetical protein
LIKTPSEEEEEEDKREYDEDGVTLFNKFIKQRRPYKGDRREKPRSKRVCYNYSKNEHFITQCPYERKEKDNEKKRKLDKGYKKDKKFTKKKPYGQAHVGQEWNSNDESSKSKVIKWQPSLSMTKLHQVSHSFQTSPSTHAS